MNVEKMIMKGKIEPIPDELDIKDVIEKSRHVFLKQEENKNLTYFEFLLNQLITIKKQWWILQFVVLCFAWYVLATETERLYLRRETGVLAILFVILIIPELWKNLSNKCMEIEVASYYSLRKIYASKLLLFGFVDMLILTVFTSGAHFISNIDVVDILVNFLLPMIVATGICFLILCDHRKNMGTVIGYCIAWNLMWWIISGNEQIYTIISTQLWIGIFILACIFMIYAILNLLRKCNACMEVNFNEFNFG